MKCRIEALSRAIREKAEELGLEFVSGPGVTPEAPRASLGTTNGQARGVYLFSVREKR